MQYIAIHRRFHNAVWLVLSLLWLACSAAMPTQARATSEQPLQMSGGIWSKVLVKEKL